MSFLFSQYKLPPPPPPRGRIHDQKDIEHMILKLDYKVDTIAKDKRRKREAAMRSTSSLFIQINLLGFKMRSTAVLVRTLSHMS